MVRADVLVATCLFVVGCGSSGVRELNRTALRQAGARSIAATMGKTPRFQVWTPTAGALFGFVGAAIESAYDERSLRAVGLHDPAETIAETLVDAMGKRFSLRVIDAADLDEGRAPNLMMRVRTLKWGVFNAVNGGATVMYDGTLQLIDTRTNEVLAQASCVSHPVEGQPVSALAANGSALLRDELREVTEYCMEDYRHRVLGLY